MVITERDSTIVRDLANSVRSHLSADELSKSDRGDRDRIEFALDPSKNGRVIKEIESQIQLLLKSDKNACGKSKVKALKWKNLGNSAFGKGQYDKALQLYNQCIASMSHDGTKDISIAYANRSAALFHLGESSLAQQDVKSAFSLNYPKELTWKLHERLGRCHLHQNNVGEACRCFKQALTALQDVQEADESKIVKARTVLEQLIKSNSSSSSSSSSNFFNCTDSNASSSSSQQKKPDSENGLVPELTGGESKSLRSASNSLTLARNADEGRFVVANQDIQPGDVILVQKSYVSTLLPEFYHQQCYRCFIPIKAPIFCKTCSLASYCSVKCREGAWTDYHKFECGILGVLQNSGISITCYMALRLIVQTGVKELVKWADLVEEMEKNGEDKENVKNSDVDRNTATAVATSDKSNKKIVGLGLVAPSDLRPNEEYRADHTSLLRLVTHTSRRGSEDIFQRTVMTLFLLSLLKTTGFLSSSSSSASGPKEQEQKSAEAKEKEEEKEASGSGIGSLDKSKEGQNGEKIEGAKKKKTKKNEDEVSVGTILLRSLQFLQFNAHEIAGWDSEQSTSVFLGGGLFLSLALFNHSCNPAIVRYFINDTVVVRAVRTIYRGEQVTENYGPLFTSSSREERRLTLQNQYWFHCQCVCCREDWPQFDVLSFSKMGLRFRCRFCHSYLGSEDESSMGLLLECRRCSRPTNILKSLKDIQKTDGRYNEAMDFMSKGREETALGILIQNIALFDSILLPPFRDYHVCQEAVRKCFLTLGNKAHIYTPL